MSGLNTFRRPLAAAIALAVLAGCATNPDGSIAMDDKAKGALIGAAAGCALGAAVGGKGGCAKGAVVGAAAGFLIGWYFESKKIADARSINQQYASSRDRSIAKPPRNEVVPAAFDTQVRESPPDAQGQKEVQITSNTDLIGYGDRVPNVQQKYAIYDEHNKLIEEKTEKVAAVDGAGRYQTNSKFKLPADAKDHDYTVKTELVSNGKSYKQNSYKVTFGGDGQLILLALAD